MRRPKKRTVLILAALLLFVGITVIVWEVADWPPPRLILRYGFPPTGGPTGRTKVIEGIEFVELMPGYVHVCWRVQAIEGDLLGRLGKILGVPVGSHPRRARCYTDQWVEVSSRFWIAVEGDRPFLLPHDQAGDPLCIAGAPETTPRTHRGTRPPAEDELLYAAACGVFPGSVMLEWRRRHRTEHTVLMLGRSWQGADGPVSDVLDLRSGPPEFWSFPPPIWIPPEDR